MAAQFCTGRIFAVVCGQCSRILIAANITIAENYILWRTFLLKKCGSYMVNYCALISPKATEFGEITQNNGHCAVQGHSRSPILRSTYVSHSHPALYSRYSELLVQFALSIGVHFINATHSLAGMNPSMQNCEILASRTRNRLLSHDVKCTSIVKF